MRSFSTNSLRILSVLITAILITATVKAFDGMGETAAEAEYKASSAASCQDNR